MRLMKSMKFDSAHRLTFHKGKCRNLHGHTWAVEVEVVADDCDDMIIDFGEIKRFIEEKFDHKVLVWSGDTPLVEFLLEMEWEHSVFSFEPTAENLARHIQSEVYDQVKSGLPQDAEMQVFITLWETESNGVKV